MLGELLVTGESEIDRMGKVDFDWESHVKNGHWPPSRRCRMCIAASARQRPHRRVGSPASWTMSLDTIGPYCKSGDETVSQLRYILVACLLVPVDAHGKPVLGENQQHHTVEEDQATRETITEERDVPAPADDLPAWEDLWGEISALDDGEPAEADPEALERCRKDGEEMSAEERMCVVPGLKWKEVVFTENVKRKSPAAIEEAVARIIREVKELGFPIHRIHSDSGAEFVSPNMRKLAMRHHLKQTCSAPEEHNSNGRIENVVLRLKNQMRIYLHSPGADVSLWPLAARAVSSMWRAQVLRAMGMPMPVIAPFGTQVQVLARTWLKRSKLQTWTPKAVPAMVLCPALLVKHGYVVRTGKRLSVVTRLFQGEEPPFKATIAQEESDIPLAHSMGPEVHKARHDIRSCTSREN